MAGCAELVNADSATAQKFLAMATEHRAWAAGLRGLIVREIVSDQSIEELQHGLAMSAKVIQAMESERLKLCTELLQLKAAKG